MTLKQMPQYNWKELGATKVYLLRAFKLILIDMNHWKVMRLLLPEFNFEENGVLLVAFTTLVRAFVVPAEQNLTVQRELV